MPTTLPPHGWRVPLQEERPAGATQITQLAVDIGATVAGIQDEMARGVTTHTTAVQTLPTGTVWVAMAAGTASGPDAGAWSGGVFTVPRTGVWEVDVLIAQSGAVSVSSDIFARWNGGKAQAGGRLAQLARGGVSMTWTGTLTAGATANVEMQHSLPGTAGVITTVVFRQIS